MSIVNPIADAYTFFINVFACLPPPVQYFAGLAVILIVISTIVSMVFRG